jgi:hypothetical protein
MELSRGQRRAENPDDEELFPEAMVTGYEGLIDAMKMMKR